MSAMRHSMILPVVLRVFLFWPGGRSSHFSQFGHTGSTRYCTLLVSDKKHSGEPISPVVSSPYDLCLRTCALQIQLLQISHRVFVFTPSPIQHCPICCVASCCTLWIIIAGASLPGFSSGVLSFIVALLFVSPNTEKQLTENSLLLQGAEKDVRDIRDLVHGRLGRRRSDLHRLGLCRRAGLGLFLRLRLPLRRRLLLRLWERSRRLLRARRALWLLRLRLLLLLHLRCGRQAAQEHVGVVGGRIPLGHNEVGLQGLDHRHGARHRAEHALQRIEQVLWVADVVVQVEVGRARNVDKQAGPRALPRAAHDLFGERVAQALARAAVRLAQPALLNGVLGHFRGAQHGRHVALLRAFAGTARGDGCLAGGDEELVDLLEQAQRFGRDAVVALHGRKQVTRHGRKDARKHVHLVRVALHELRHQSSAHSFGDAHALRAVLDAHRVGHVVAKRCTQRSKVERVVVGVGTEHGARVEQRLAALLRLVSVLDVERKHELRMVAVRLADAVLETNRYHSQLVLPLNIKNGDKAQKGRKALLDTGAVFGPDANDDSFDSTPLRAAFRDYVADSVRIKGRAKRVRVAEAVGGGLVAQLMQSIPDKVHVLSGIFTAMARDLFTAMERDNCVSPESLRLLEEINQFFVAASKTPVPARRAGEGTQQRNMSAMLRAAEVAEDAIEKSRLREAHSRSSKSLRNALAEEVVSGPWQGARSGLFVYVSRSANLYLDDNIRYPEHLFDALKGMLGAVARSVPMIETLEANFIVAEWDSAANYTNMLLRRLPSTSEVQQKQKAKAKKPKSPARAQQPPATLPQPQEQTPPQRQAQPQEQAQSRPPAQAEPVQVTPSASKSPVDQVTDISDIFLSALQK